MILAGLSAQGITQVENIEYVRRGYENLVNKLIKIGAQIEEERWKRSETKEEG